VTVQSKYINNSALGFYLLLLRKNIAENALVKNSGIYLLFALISGLINFLVLPILSHLLTVEDIGILGIFSIINQLLTPIIGLSMNAIIAKSYYSRDDINSLVGSSQIFSCLIFCIILLIALMLPSGFTERWGINQYTLVSTCVIAFIGINNAVLLAIFQLEKKPFYWGISIMSSLIINLSVTFFILFNVQMNYWARIFGFLISSITTLLLNLYFTNKLLLIQYSLNISHFRYFVRLGSPLIIVAICNWGLYALDRIFIQSFIGIQAVGYYTMAFALASPLKIISESFSRAWLPHAYLHIKEKQQRKLFHQSILIFGAFVCMGLILATVGKSVLSYLIDEKFSFSFQIMPILVAGFVINIASKLFTPFILIAEKTNLLSLISLAAFAVNAIGNYFLIPYAGIFGAAFATLISFTFMNSLVTWAALKLDMAKPKNLICV
jgi:O-antigen/teichoic acid export membrane protein